MDVGTERDHPIGKEYDKTVSNLFIYGFHDFGNVLDNCRMIAILMKGLKVFLSRISIRVGRITSSDTSS